MLANSFPAIFVSGLVKDKVKSFLKSSHYPLGSSGYAYKNFQNLRYAESNDDILLNSNYWDVDFHGFRFPYTKPGFWGMRALDENHYSFESSIGANNIDFIYGSVFPYNIVIANNGFYKTTDILEIAPVYHDDYYFLNAIYTDNNPNASQLYNRTLIYSKYLENFWDYAVKPYHGLMVYLGHPQYVGFNDTTVLSLTNLIKKVKHENVWITTMNDVADFRRNLSELQFNFETGNDELEIEISSPENIFVEDVTINFLNKIKSASAKKGKTRIVGGNEKPKLIFDAFNGQKVTVHY